MSLAKKYKLKKVLIIANHYRNRSPGQRFRIEQYMAFLEENGYKCQLSNFITPENDKFFSKSGNYFRKGQVLLKAISIRLLNLIRVEDYDIIFVFREALPIGTSLIERLLKKRGARIIFDFDDAIWLQNVSKENEALAFLKNATKTKKLIELSDVIFAGNKYLADYARKFNSNVKIIPTTIDMVHLHNKTKLHEDKESITVGWTGTHSTLKYLEQIEDVLVLLTKTKNIQVLVIGDRVPVFKELTVKFLPWKLASEVEDLLNIDIGIMPLTNDQWSKGKCGFKVLQYLSLGIPAVASPVGVNTEIIADEKNGFFASNKTEWLEKLSILINSTEKRKEMGKAGQKVVKDRYSVNAFKAKYLDGFNEVLRF